MNFVSDPPTLEARLPLVLAAMHATLDANLPAGPYRELSARLVAGVGLVLAWFLLGLTYLEYPLETGPRPLAPGHDAQLVLPFLRSRNRVEIEIEPAIVARGSRAETDGEGLAGLGLLERHHVEIVGHRVPFRRS